MVIAPRCSTLNIRDPDPAGALMQDDEDLRAKLIGRSGSLTSEAFQGL